MIRSGFDNQKVYSERTSKRNAKKLDLLFLLYRIDMEFDIKN